MRDSRTDRYSLPAIILHWVIAVGVVTMIVLGWTMLAIPKEPPGPRVAAFNLHKSIGITIFGLMVARLAWRMSHPPPPLPPMPAWQSKAARFVHALIYVCLFVMPLAGFIASSFSGRPIVYFGRPLPVLLAKNDAAAKVFYAIHFTTSWVLIAAVATHISAAVKHQFIDKDGLIRRMWPWGAPALTSLRSRRGVPAD